MRAIAGRGAAVFLRVYRLARAGCSRWRPPDKKNGAGAG